MGLDASGDCTSKTNDNARRNLGTRLSCLAYFRRKRRDEGRCFAGI